jgi:2-methylcitrate dehydratase PrpD
MTTFVAAIWRCDVAKTEQGAMQTLATSMARFIAGLNLTILPSQVAEKAKACLLNAYGMGLNGYDTPYAPVARAAAVALDGEVAGGATLLGDGRRTTVGGACLANSALFHGRAQEDTCGAAHFGTVLVPMLTAMIEVQHYPMARLLPALVAGYEAGGLLEKAYAARTTPGGFRSSAIYGTIAAAAAAGKLMSLEEAQVATALSNAVSFAGGVLQSFSDGTDEWRYQVGVVARNGLLAAELARAGAIAAPHAFEGRTGFIASFARADCEVAGLANLLGREWATLRVAFKPYPVCAFNQTPVTAALELRRELGGVAIRSVRVRMNPFETGYAGMDATGPFNSISGTLMSIPFCIATTLIHGVPDMKRMTTYDDVAVNNLVNCVELISDNAVPVLSAIIEVETTAGRWHRRDQRMTAADYAYDRPTVAALVRGTGVRQDLPSAAFDLLERFVEQLPDGSIEDVLASFAMLPAVRPLP